MRIETILNLTAGICCFDIRRCGIGQAIGGAAQAAGNVASSAISSGVNYKIAKEANETNIALAEANNEANKQIAAERNANELLIAQEANALNERMFHEQNDWNLNMWKMENEYNSPAAQMERLIEAGVNPNMITGGNAVGSAGAGNSTSVPESANWAGAEVADLVTPNLQAAVVEPWRLDAPKLPILETLQMMSDIKNTNADTEKKIADTERAILDNMFFEDTYYTELDIKEWELKNAASTNDLIRSNSALNRDKRKSEEVRRRLMEAQTAKEKELERSYKQATDFAIKTEDKQIELIDQNVKNARRTWDEIGSRIGLNQANASSAYAAAAAYRADAEESRANANLLNERAAGQKLENAFAFATFEDRVKAVQNSTEISDIEKKQALADLEKTRVDIINTFQGINLDNEDKELIAQFLYDNPDCSAQKLFKCLQDLHSSPFKDNRQKWGFKVWDFATKLILKLIPTS